MSVASVHLSTPDRTPSRARVEVTEHGLVFPCGSDSLIGVLVEPGSRREQVGVVIVVGGPQYRAGSHRQFVLLARHLAASGYATLRFDARGMGDSSGAPRHFSEQDDDVGAAIDALLSASPGLSRVVLWGLCDGASAALLQCRRRQDSRVIGLCLLNPWLRSDTSLARTQVRHYYLQRLLQGAFWRKVLTGGVGPAAVQGLWRSLRQTLKGSAPAAQPATDAGPADEDFRNAMAAAWRTFHGSILLVLSGKDYTAKEFLDGVTTEPAWRGALERTGVHRVDLSEADHTFSNDGDRQACERAVTDWLHVLNAAACTESGR